MQKVLELSWRLCSAHCRPQQRASKTMKIAKIADIANLSPGTKIGQMTVTLKKVYPAKTGEGQYGPWSVRGAVISDETGEIRASFWDCDVSDLEGRVVTLKSRAGAKGLAGLEVKANKQGENEISFSNKGSLIEGAASGDSQPSLPLVKTSAATVKAVQKLTVEEVGKRLDQHAELYEQCVLRAQSVMDRIGVTDAEQIRCCASSLYITGERNGYSSAFEVATPTKAELEDDDIKW